MNANDKKESATFLAELLGLAAPAPSGHFLAVQQTRPGEVATRNPGRAIYFADPSGHWLEMLT